MPAIVNRTHRRLTFSVPPVLDDKGNVKTEGLFIHVGAAMDDAKAEHNRGKANLDKAWQPRRTLTAEEYKRLQASKAWAGIQGLEKAGTIALEA